MAVAYTFRLGYLNQNGPADVVLYVCPANRRAVVRDIVGNVSNEGGFITVYVRTPGSVTYPVGLITSLAPAVHHLELRQALDPGDELHVDIQTNAGTVAVTAYDLALT